MLHFIRERAQGWVAWFIVGLISIPFALWGVNSYLTGPSDVIVATVNGESIKQAEYQRAFQQYRDQMRNMMGEQFDPSLFDSMAIKQSVLNSLIDKKLLLLVASDLGQSVSNRSLNQSIQSTPAFQTQGAFDTERYSMMLQRIGLNPERYEAELRISAMNQELTANVQQSSLAGQYATDNLLRLEKQSREIAYGVIPALSLLDDVVIEPQDVQAYYDEHSANYYAPERLSVDYIELSVDELSKNIVVNDEQLQSYYIDNQDQFVAPEQRRVSHILIEGDEQQAFTILEDVKAKLAAGEDFAALAIEYSQDPASAQQGGDLGYFQQDVMDAAFDQAVFSLNEEQVSEIVATEYGYHLIKLTDIKAGEGKSFSESKAEISSLYRRQQAESEFYEKAEQLADLSYENPDSLQLAAEELDLQIKTSSEFQREGNISGIATEQKVVAAAFSEDVLVNKLNSAVIEINSSHLMVVHENTHIEASQLAYASVAPAITEQLRFEQAAEKAMTQGEDILSQLKSGVMATNLFSDNNWHEVTAYDRTSKELSEQVLQRAFSMSKPQAQAQYLGFTANNGNYIIIKLVAVNEAVTAETNIEEREGLQSHLDRIYGDSELQAFINSLKEQAEIEVFQSSL